MQTSTCLLVSTILKTIPSDVNKSGKAFEILGKKASDLKAAFDNAGGGIRGVRSALAELTKKDFKLNDAGEIITKDNIDSFIPKIKNKQANDLAERIAELGEDNTSLDIFYQSLSKGEERYIKDFIKNTEDLSKVTGEDLVKANQNARQSAPDQNEALQQQTLSAKAASFAMGALKAATNIGLAMLASLAINGIITLITNACQSIDEKIKELNQEFEQSVKKVKSISDEFKSFKSSADEIIPQYAKLAQGVDKFGNNVSLTDEEYQEFIELNNKIGEMFPEINVGLDSNGNAMLSLSGDADTLTKSLYDLVDAQRAAANQQIADEFDNAFDTTDELNNSYEQLISKHEFQVKQIQNAYNEISKLSDNGLKTANPENLDKILNLSLNGEEYFVSNFSKLRKKYIDADKRTVDWEGLFNDEDFKALYDKAIKSHELQINNIGEKIKLTWKKLGNSVGAVIADNPIYQGLNEQEKQLANILGAGIDFEGLSDRSSNGVKDYIETNILTPLLSLPDEALNNIAKLQSDFQEGLIPDEDFKKQFISEYRDIFLTIYEGMDSNSQIEFADNFVRAMNAVGIEGKSVVEVLNNLADSYINVADSTEEAVTAQKTYTEIVSGVEGLTEALEILGKVYQDVQNKEGFDWSSILNNDDFKEKFSNSTEAYDNFIKTVTQSPDNIEACQSAFNNLVGEYINASGVLNDLTEDTRDAAVAMLEQGGIVNAAEIVDAKLKQLAVTREHEAEMTELQKIKTLENKIAYLKDIGMTKETAQALLGLINEKIKFNATKIETKDDINNLIALAEEANATKETINQLKRANRVIGEDFNQSLYDYGKSIAENKNGIHIGGAYDAKAFEYYQNYKALLDTQAGNLDFEPTEFKIPEYNYDGSTVETGSGSSSSQEDSKKTFNWIEKAIEKVQKAATKLSNVAKSVYKTLTARNNALTEQVRTINKEIALQEKAYTAYMKKANSVGLSAELTEKVQNGAVDISEYDSETAEIIEKYQEWYEKALDCKDAIDELHESLAALYKEKFENIQNDFANQIREITHLSNMYDIGIDTAEAKGYVQSIKFYAALQDSQKTSLATLNQELASLKSSFSEAMASGEIEEYSEEWYEYRDAIHNVSEEIAKGNQQLAEYAKTMREIEWGHFDYLQERISDITTEADFLIDLFGDAKLFDDKGNYTNDGLASLGLHAQNYNVLMAQADKYAEEAANIERQMSADKYNVDLINRKRELIKLQQESIKSAEDEKKAMTELAKQGIEEQINSLKNLIQAYTDALDAAKDLNDYQKKIADQTSEIASLEKQLLAYENDNSEETKTTVQKIKSQLKNAKENLKETEYDHYISEQKALLDNLYAEYEDFMNQRMDNLEVEFAELIATVNSNSGTIANTINEAADSVGYTLSDSMRTVWNEASTGIKDVVALYGDNFLDKFTTVNDALSRIANSVSALIAAANGNANATIDDIKSNADIKTDSNTKVPASDKTNTDKNSNNQNKAIKVGGRIYAGNAKIYDYAGAPASEGERQVFAHDPIYTVLREAGDYVLTRWYKANSGYTGWFKKSDVTAYKTGGLVDYTGLAQLDGTPSKPEYVLNPDETKNFLALNEQLRKLSDSGALANMANMLRGNMLPDRAGIRTGNISSDTTIGDININIEHVEDYNDFVNQLKSDRQFEKMVQAMTVDRAVGKGALVKNKFKW